MFNSRKPSQAAWLAAGALLAGVSLAGCSSNTPPTPTVVNTAPPPAPDTTTVVPSGASTTVATTDPSTKINVNAGPGTSQGTDEATGEAVNKAIVTNKEMTGARVEAVVTAGVATLTGSVQNQQQKALAEKAAHDTPGVSSVKNKLQINPTGGAKSASKPPVTKVIVVHKTVIAPAPPGPPASSAAPASGSDSSTGTGAPGDSSTSSPAAGAAPDSSAPGTTAPATNGTSQ